MLLCGTTFQSKLFTGLSIIWMLNVQYVCQMYEEIPTGNSIIMTNESKNTNTEVSGKSFI